MNEITASKIKVFTWWSNKLKKTEAKEVYELEYYDNTGDGSS